MTARRVIESVQREFIDNMGSVSLAATDFIQTGVLPAHSEGFNGVPAAGAFITHTTLPIMGDHPGIWCLSTGAVSAAGRVFILTQAGGTIFGSHEIGAGGITRVGTWLRTGLLSTALQRFTIRAGFSSMGLPNVLNEGVTFEYNDAENGGRWQAVNGDAPGVETSVDTGITVAADTWYRLELEVNAAGTSVEFFIGVAGAAPVSVATNTLNIPAAPGFALFYSAHIMKLIGTAARSIYVDAAYVYQEISR